MANLTSVKEWVQLESARFRSAVSEALIQTIGASVNWLLDYADANDAALVTLKAKTKLKLTQSISGSPSTTNGTTFYTCPASTYALLQIKIDATGSERVMIDGVDVPVVGGWLESVFVRPGQALSAATETGSYSLTYSGIEFKSLSLDS